LSKLDIEFYRRENVLTISRELLGKILCTNFKGTLTTGIIVETEAYAGVDDMASHAYGGKRTDRTETMYAKAGTAYVYLCYGIHHLFNVVTNAEGIPHAILIRAIEPMEGIDNMLKRRKMDTLKTNLTSGPGILSQALGIQTSHSGISLLGDEIWIEDIANLTPHQDCSILPAIPKVSSPSGRGRFTRQQQFYNNGGVRGQNKNDPTHVISIISSPRVGCQNAGKDANNPWRFRIKGNKWVSPAK